MADRDRAPAGAAAAAVAREARTAKARSMDWTLDIRLRLG